MKYVFIVEKGKLEHSNSLYHITCINNSYCMYKMLDETFLKAYEKFTHNYLIRI